MIVAIWLSFTKNILLYCIIIPNSYLKTIEIELKNRLGTEAMKIGISQGNLITSE